MQWISENLPKSEIARRLSCNVDTLKSYLNKMDIQYGGNMGGKGVKTFDNPLYMPFDVYINRRDANIITDKIRKKLLREGLKQYVCERCGNTQWMNQPIPLEVHHIDGNKNNNELNNLQLLCPNCHALTPTYRGKNIKR